MRLLNVTTLEFKEFHESNCPPYVIASHRWTSDETAYKDFRKRRNVESVGHRKVLDFCSFVQRTSFKNTRAFSVLGLERNCQWLWIDTICIDKTSSAELSESINSMFHWYGKSEICYAYLPDVGPMSEYESTILDFVQSDWFKRGRTLQELLAPRTVVFLTKSWEVLGHKCRLSKCDMTCRGFGACLNAKLSKITNIPLDVLQDCAKSQNYDIVTRKSWASMRKTTRTEDRAYCLLGLFDVHLVPIYGERDHAWERLEEEITRKQERKKQRARNNQNSQSSQPLLPLSNRPFSTAFAPAEFSEPLLSDQWYQAATTSLDFNYTPWEMAPTNYDQLFPQFSVSMADANDFQLFPPAIVEEKKMLEPARVQEAPLKRAKTTTKKARSHMRFNRRLSKRQKRRYSQGQLPVTVEEDEEGNKNTGDTTQDLTGISKLFETSW